MDGFQRFVLSFSAKVSLPIILMSPVLFFFTLFSLMDDTFHSLDRQVVVLLWVLVVLSLATFLLLKKDGDAPPLVMFTLGSAQLVGIVATCLSMLVVVEEDSNTPRRRLSDSFRTTPFLINPPAVRHFNSRPH